VLESSLSFWNNTPTVAIDLTITLVPWPIPLYWYYFQKCWNGNENELIIQWLCVEMAEVLQYSKLINYSTNVCWNGQGITIFMTTWKQRHPELPSLKNVTRHYYPCYGIPKSPCKEWAWAWGSEWNLFLSPAGPKTGNIGLMSLEANPIRFPWTWG